MKPSTAMVLALLLYALFLWGIYSQFKKTFPVTPEVEVKPEGDSK